MMTTSASVHRLEIASPRNPYVCTWSMSSKAAILLVVLRWPTDCPSSARIPVPLSRHYVIYPLLECCGCTLMEVKPSSWTVSVICVEWASMAFSISSLSIIGTSWMTWPLEIRLTVFESSLVSIPAKHPRQLKQSKSNESINHVDC